MAITNAIVIMRDFGNVSGVTVAARALRAVCAAPAIGWSIRRFDGEDHEQDQRQFEARCQVQELRDDELQKVNGGYIFTDVMVESIVAPRDFNSGHTVGFSLGATQTGTH